MVYGITPQTISTEEGLKSYRETPPVLEHYECRPKVTQSPALFTNTIQGTSAFVVIPRKVVTTIRDINKEAVEGRAPPQLTAVFEEKQKRC